MTKREHQVLALIQENPLISQSEIAARIGISRSAVAGYVMKLTAKGIVKGRGYVISDGAFVVIVGGANIDICGAPGVGLRMGDSNPGAVTSSPGGVARNVAENLARLGVDCRLITAVGNDHHGDLLCDQGRAVGIDMRHVMRLDTVPTSTYVSVLDNSGDMLVAINDMSIVDEIRPDRLRRHEPMLKQAHLLVADTNLSSAALAYLGQAAAGQPMFIDAVSAAKAKRILPSLDTVHTLKATRIEAEELCGFSSKGTDNLPKIANWFHERGVKRIFITLGTDGVFYSQGDEQGYEDASDAPDGVANANGAGDAFVAGLAYAWMNDWTL